MKNVDCFLIHLFFAINLSRYLVFIAFLLKVSNVVDHNEFKILGLILSRICHIQSVFIFSTSESGIKHRALNLRNVGLVNELDVTPNVPRTKITEELALHNHPYYHVCPDILSMVRDPLSGNGCGSLNNTYI